MYTTTATPPDEKIKVSFDARAADIARVDREARERQLSRAVVIREALRAFLSETPGPARA